MSTPSSIPTSGRYLDNAPDMVMNGYLLCTIEDDMLSPGDISTYYIRPDRWQYILERMQDDCTDHRRVQEIWLENANDANDQVCLWKRS